LATQGAITALAEAVQGDWTRLPGPVVAHTEQAQSDVLQAAMPVALHVLPAVHAGRLQTLPTYFFCVESHAHEVVIEAGLVCVGMPEHVMELLYCPL